MFDSITAMQFALHGNWQVILMLNSFYECGQRHYSENYQTHSKGITITVSCNSGTKHYNYGLANVIF